MGKIVTAAALCILVAASGCGKQEAKNVSPAPPVAGHSAPPEGFKGPHYTGLIEEYRTILQEDPNNLAAIIGLGNAYFDSGQWKKAATMYEHALRVDPRNPDVRTDMGTCFRNMGLPDRALAEYRTALTHDAGHLNARYNMGVVYALDKHDASAAVRVWEELLKIAPNHPRAESMRAMIANLKKQTIKGGR